MALDPIRIQLICFDIDGTLADTDDLIVDTIVKFLNPLTKYFFNFNSARIVRRLLMGFETPANFLFHLSDRLGLDNIYSYLKKSRPLRKKRKRRKYRLIPGAEKTLQELANRYQIAIISARDENFTQEFIHHSQLTSIIKFFVSADTCSHTKPYPDPLILAASKGNISPENCLMVGDTTVDILAGKRAGAQAVGVLSGFGEEDELIAAGADAIIPDVTVLLNILSS